MAKVIQAFRERYHNMKLYKIGDEYPEDDADRVQYLTKQGFLNEENDSEPSVSLNFEEFAVLPAPEQKKLLADLGIEGDDGNAEKREALYSTYLASVSGNGDSDA
ncbi:hypothetical protein [Paenibacillus ehimensis]|uniref:Uncharacterized protein n=1 Tax=Paenibacillus ehimensis TaxID=79264 RepID=A0ABT8VHG9_9BACL|nr:hypothetical protein [Paenibacillus ehimensis]MDO3680425.1 hypothetical protein [Paenibacillus ehimensis]